jgi:hypothetical protein
MSHEKSIEKIKTIAAAKQINRQHKDDMKNKYLKYKMKYIKLKKILSQKIEIFNL